MVKTKKSLFHIDDYGNEVYWENDWDENTYIMKLENGQFQAVYGNEFVDNYDNIDNAANDINNIIANK
ncbi:MAG: hypothetical protein GY941_23490 [Planctomycetes bacterium]|nr:hypothetical protein [Planctomycetota bacterium]